LIDTRVVPRIVFGRFSWNVSDELYERVSPYHICSDNVSPVESFKHYLRNTFVTIEKLALDSFRQRTREIWNERSIESTLNCAQLIERTRKIIKSD
jgi:hypothetical protein